MAYAVLIKGVEVAQFGQAQDAGRFILEQLDLEDAAEIVEVPDVA